MRFLKTFGGLSLANVDGAPALPESAQRRLVLLALAVEAGQRGLPRDRAVAFLWPDADDERGRRSLNQLRYTLRRELGADPLLGTLTLRPDPAVLTSDLDGFRTAIATGDVDAALAVCSAPFLDGVALGGSAELDEWAEGCRAEVRRGLERLVEGGAREAQATGDLGRAELLWRRLIQLEPLSAPYVVGLMETLAAAGNASEALVAAANHEALVQRELGVAPDATVKAAASAIRARTAANAARPTPLPETGAKVAQPERNWDVEERPEIAPREASRRAHAIAADVVARPNPRRLVPVAVVMVLVAVAAVLLWSQRRGPDVTLPRSTVAVLPFTVRGGPDYEYLGEGMVTLLSSKLGGGATLRPADGRAVVSQARRAKGASTEPERAAEVARQLGAGSYIMGDVVGVDGRLRLDAVAYRQGSAAPVARASVEGAPSALFELVDSLAGTLLEALSDPAGRRLTRPSEGMPVSLEAMKAYLEGEQLFRQGRSQAAFNAFSRASALDTTFALANYWASVAGWWAEESDTIIGYADVAVRHAGRVAERHRLLLVAWDTLLNGDPREAERIYRAVLGVEPDNVAAWFQLGEVQFHYATRRGTPISASRAAFERVLSYEPDEPGALMHVARIAASEGRWAELDSVGRRLARVDSAGEWGQEFAALAAAARRDSAGLAHAAAALAGAPDGRIWNEALYGWRAGLDAEGTRQLLQPMISSNRAPEVRARGHAALGWLGLARGRMSQFTEEMDRAAALDPLMALEHGALALAMPFVPASPAELAETRRVLMRWDVAGVRERIGASHVGGIHDDAHPAILDYLVGSLSARMGDAREAESRATLLDRMADRQAGSLAHYSRAAAASVRAQVAFHAGRDAEVTRILEPSLALETRITRAGASPFYVRGLERFLLAESLRRQGRSQEAEPWYRSFHDALFDAPYLAQAYERLGEIARGRGESGAAEDSVVHRIRGG